MSALEQPRRLLGLLLIEMGVISEEPLEQALGVQEESGGRLGDILIARGYTSRLAIQDALAQQSGLWLEPEEGYGTGLRAKLIRREERIVPQRAEAPSHRQEDRHEEVSRADVRFLHPEEHESEDELAALKAMLADYVRVLAERDDRLRQLEEEARVHRFDADARAEELEQARVELEGLRAERDEGEDQRRELGQELDLAHNSRTAAENALRAQEQRLRELEDELETEAARRVDIALEAERAGVELKRLWADHAGREQRLDEVERALERARSARGEAEAELAKRDDRLRRLEEDERARRAKTETQAGELEQARVELKRLQTDGAKREQRRSELEQELELSRSAFGEAEVELA